MRLLFDSGSSWMWVPSENCPKNECVKNHYKQSSSSSFRNMKIDKEINYGKGSVKGQIVKDEIKFSSDKADPAVKMNFLLVNSAKELGSLFCDGIVGLSPKVPDAEDDVQLFVRQLKK